MNDELISIILNDTQVQEKAECIALTLHKENRLYVNNEDFQRWFGGEEFCKSDEVQEAIDMMDFNEHQEFVGEFLDAFHEKCIRIACEFITGDRE